MAAENQDIDRRPDFEPQLFAGASAGPMDDDSLGLADDDSLDAPRGSGLPSRSTELAQGETAATNSVASQIGPSANLSAAGGGRSSLDASASLRKRWEGKRLSHFRLMRLLGAGYTGVVFQAEDINLKRIVALKVLRRQIKGVDDIERVERFLLEARTAAALDHPSIAHVYEINEQSGWWYIAMEFLEGGSLRDLQKAKGALPPSQAALTLLDAARGLAAAHAAGVIHRDVKPANLMLTRLGRCKLVDFGLVNSEAADNPFRDDGQRVIGSPHYIAPEVIREKGATDASDVYSVGATLYHLIAGRPPFPGDNIREVFRQHVQSPPPDLRKHAPACSPALAEMVRGAMAKSPADRPTVEEIVATLQTEVMSSASSQGGMLTGSGSGRGSGLDLGVLDLGESGAATSPLRPAKAPARSVPPWAWIAGSSVGGALLLLLGFWALSSGGERPEPPPQPAAQLAEKKPPSKPLPVQVVESTNSIGMRMRLLPAGSFFMGSPPTEPGRNQDERRLEVKLTSPFQICATEVTQGQWAAVMGEDYLPPDGVHPSERGSRRFFGEYLPAYVSWFEASEFCRRLSLKENKLYRLPTEAEWEYACRAGSAKAFSYGESLSPSAANIDLEVDDQGLKPQRRPMPVGSYPANAWGLYDMHGNVMEWCQDWMAPLPFGPATDPQGPAEGAVRVLRGGSWDAYAATARSANRAGNYPVLRTDYIGFRPVLEPGKAPRLDTPSYLADASAAPLQPGGAPAHETTTSGSLIALDPRLPPYKPRVVLEQRMRSAGSDTMDQLFRLWEQKFQHRHPEVKFRHEGLGSGTAVPALVEGLVHFGPMSRPMKAEETAQFLSEFGYEPTQVRVAIDALAVYVHPSNPVAKRGLSLAELDAIYSTTRKQGNPRDIATWGDLGLAGEWAQRPIRPFGRNEASGTYGVVLEMVLAKGTFKPSVTALVGSEGVLDAVERDPAAIGYSGIGYNRPGVSTAPLSNTPEGERLGPTPRAAYAGTYPLARPMYITINQPPDSPIPPMVREFLAFVYSREGQQCVIDAGFFPLTKELADAEIRRVVQVSRGQGP